MKDEKKTKILSTIDKASGPVSIGYICKHCNFADSSALSELLNELKREGYIQCCSPNPWSLSLGPQYEITPQGRLELETRLLR